MTRAVTACLLAVLIPPCQLFAQSVDEIIAKYVATIGGTETLHSVKTIRRTGNVMAGMGIEIVMLQENKRPNLIRQEMSMQGLTGVIAYDGQHGWKIEPWSGKKDAEPLGEEEFKAILEDADLDGPLV